MKRNKAAKNPQNDKPENHYDLSEEASRRGNEEATTIARRMENDDANEENNAGPISISSNDFVENKIAGSLDGE